MYFICYNAILTDIHMAVLLSFVTLIVSYACVYSCNDCINKMEKNRRVLPDIGISV